MRLTGNGTSPEVPEDAGRKPPDPTYQTEPERPLNQAWMTPELVEKTRRVWSGAYGRPISTEEAIEMLGTVRQLAEALLKRRLGIE